MGCFSTLLSIASTSPLEALMGAIVSAFFQKQRYTRYVPIIITMMGKSPFHQSVGKSPFPAIIGAMVRDIMLMSLIRIFRDGPAVSDVARLVE